MFTRKGLGFPAVFAAIVALIAPGYLMAQSQSWQADPNFAPALESSASVPVPDAIERQPDGNLLIAGRFDRLNGVAVANGYALARLLPSGATDRSFSGQLSAGQTLSRLRLQPDDKIVASGAPFVGRTPTHSITTVRFTAEGARDGTFYCDDPIAQMEIDSNGYVYGQPPGTRFGGDQLTRYAPGGDFDPTFQNYLAPTGSLTAALPDGTVVATQMGFSQYSQNIPGQLLHLQHDGTKDPDFAFDRTLLSGNLLGLLALPDNRVLAIETIHTDYGETFHFLRVGRDGKPDYDYRAQVGLPPGSSSVSVLAGVLFDVLRDANAAATTFLQLDYRALTNGSVSAGSISVGADGICYAATPAGFSKLVRVAGSGPSVDPQPSILIFSLPAATPTVNRNQGESFSISATAGGLAPFGYQWLKDGAPLAGANSSTLNLPSVTPADAGTYALTVSNASGTATRNSVTLAVNPVTTAPTIASQPISQTVDLGSAASFTVWASGNPVPSCDWFFNGSPLAFAGTTSSSGGTTSSTFSVLNAGDPSTTGIYYAVASNSVGRVTSSPAILGRSLPGIAKILGGSVEVGTDIVHPNGNIYDQVLLQGTAATIRPDAGQVTRLSFIDLNNDIVQVEFAGAGCLSLVLDRDSASGPAAPLNYNQPGVSYVKGHAGIVITGANETTNVCVFSVGRVTAFDPTGTYDILRPPGATNDPAHNGSPLFAGHDGTNYDGVADLAFIAIMSTDGKFGSVRTANASYHAIKGLTGIYAPAVGFTGPVYVGDINAFDAAFPVLLLGSAATTQINGGDLLQSNGQALKVSGITELKFVDGVTSQGVLLPAQTNQATLDQNGVNVTAQIAVNPRP